VVSDHVTKPRFARLAVVLGALAVTLGVGWGSAQAQSDTTIQAQVREQQRVDGKTNNQPVPGVTIRVLDPDGNLVAEGVTGEDGNASIPIPGPADYVVVLDEETLPEDITIAANSSAEQEVAEDSFRTSRRIVNFFTGESQATSKGLFDRTAQRFADGVQLGLILAMCAVGLSLIFGTTGLTNFAHGELVTWGGIWAYFFNVTGFGLVGFLSFMPGIDDGGRFHVLWAAPLAVGMGVLIGWFLDWGLFARLRKRGIGLISQMVITVGLSILLKNAIQFKFGGKVQFMRQYLLQDSFNLGPIQVTPRELWVTGIAFVVLLIVAWMLLFTRLGKATRAVSDNPDLASATGINSQAIIRLVWLMGGGLAALGGVLLGLELGVSFDMGGRLLFLMFAAITLGGLGSALGALVGGFFVGVAVEMASLVVPTELKTTPALLILILVLLFRPQGILGKSQRVG
jgi:branched-chain amino acid transport system permease protein